MTPVFLREMMLNKIQDIAQWDIVIIGGGATGLGAAVDAASRGYKTLLIEQYDFAAGTSSRSTKLVHGGVRYMAQGNIKLVRESLRERGILLKNAPHVCHNIKFVLPTFSWFEKIFYGIGLQLYDWIAGKKSLGKTKLLSEKSTQQLAPGLKHVKLNGAVLYHDGQFDDSRLAINLAQTAAAHGAAVINYCRMDSFVKTDGKITGLTLTNTLKNSTFTISCKSVINATGVCSDSVMRIDDPTHKNILSASQGAHIVVDNSFFPGDHAMIIPKTDDGRVLFAVPWHGKVVIGTTDTAVEHITPEPKPLREEIDFIVAHANRYLSSSIHYSDIRSVFAGLRPLINTQSQKKTAFLPRDHHISVSAAGLVTITGGKWTTYREMGKQAVDNAAFSAGLERKECITASLPIHGYTTTVSEVNTLSVYGSDAEQIQSLIRNNPELIEKIHPRLPYCKAEMIWIIENEMTMRLEDLLSRRTRALVLDAKATLEAAQMVASLMAKIMKKNELWITKELNDFTAVANQYIIN